MIYEPFPRKHRRRAGDHQAPLIDFIINKPFPPPPRKGDHAPGAFCLVALFTLPYYIAKAFVQWLRAGSGVTQ